MMELFNTTWSDVLVSPDFLGKLLVSVFFVLFLALVRRLTLRLVRGRSEDVVVLYHWQKISGYLVLVLSLALVLPLWVAGIRTPVTYLGLLSAGLAIALQGPLVNFAGWIFILWRKPFQLGDRVQIVDHAGDVIDIRPFQFTLLEIGNWVHADQSTGRVLHVPNGKVFTDVLANYTRGFEYIWNEIPVLVTFESDWRKAKGILNGIATTHGAHLTASAEQRIREAAKRFMILYTTLTPTVYTKVEDCGVLLTVRYLCEPRKRRSSIQAIWEDILDAFAACPEIDFAYPTQRFYHNIYEGKEGARAPMPPGVGPREPVADRPRPDGAEN